MITQRADYRFVSVPAEIVINSGIQPVRDVASANGSAVRGGINHWRVLRGEDPALLCEMYRRLRALFAGSWHSYTALPDYALTRDIDSARLATVERWVDQRAANGPFSTTETAYVQPTSISPRFIAAVSPASPADARAVLPIPAPSSPIWFASAYADAWSGQDHLLTSSGYLARELSLSPVLRSGYVTPTVIDDKDVAKMLGTPASLASDDIRALWHNITLLRRVVDPYDLYPFWDFAVNQRWSSNASIGGWDGSKVYEYEAYTPSGGGIAVDSCKVETAADLYDVGKWQSYADDATWQANLEARVAATFGDNPWALIGLFTIRREMYAGTRAKAGEGAIATLATGTGISYGASAIPSAATIGNVAQQVAQGSSLWLGATVPHTLSVYVSPHIIVDIDSRLAVPLSAWHWPGTDYRVF